MNTSLMMQIREEYKKHLTDILLPFIYQGIMDLYGDAQKIAHDRNKEETVLLIFQKLLLGVPGWNTKVIEDETKRIKEKSGTMEYFDALVMETIRRDILLLTYENPPRKYPYTVLEYHKTLSIEKFVHACYIETSRESYNKVYLFYHAVDPMEYRKNQNAVFEFIKTAIDKAIRCKLPLKEILLEQSNAKINSEKGIAIGAVNEPVVPVVIPETPLPNTRLEVEEQTVDVFGMSECGYDEVSESIRQLTQRRADMTKRRIDPLQQNPLQQVYFTQRRDLVPPRV